MRTVTEIIWLISRESNPKRNFHTIYSDSVIWIQETVI
jgi:hypothetical protein